MKTRTETVMHDDGTFQRFQVISNFEWDDIKFHTPGIEPKAVDELVRLYKVVIYPTLPVHLGSFVFFHVPEGMELPFDRHTKNGYVFDDDVLFKQVLEAGYGKGEVRLDGDKLVSDDPGIEKVIEKLYSAGMVGVSTDEGPQLIFIPINEKMGFISRKKASMVVNSHFFLMDPTDMDSPYCKVGTPHGLILDHGHVKNPPLNHRTLLLVDGNDKATISRVELRDLTFLIDGIEYRCCENCSLHFRPDERVTPKHDGTDLIITEEEVVAVKEGGESVIPVAGFVISVPGKVEIRDNRVLYKGLEEYKFGAQVGPEMMVEGEMVDHMIFPFFDFAKDDVIYAPTSYPLGFEKDRAARIMLGTDRNDKPVVVWAEGRGKLGIEAEKDSTGASLLECAVFCRSQGFRNVIHLDGGGSAQIIYEGKRLLKIADRMPVTNAECERPVPNALYID